MRLKSGVTTIKKLIFFSASLSIVALGAVVDDAVPRTDRRHDDEGAAAPRSGRSPMSRPSQYSCVRRPRRRTLRNQREQKAKDAGKDATKTNGASESTASAMVKNSGAPAANQAAPQQNAAALPQPAGQPQAAPGAPAPLPWLIQQPGGNAPAGAAAQGQAAGPNSQQGNFFDAPQQNGAWAEPGLPSAPSLRRAAACWAAASLRPAAARSARSTLRSNRVVRPESQWRSESLPSSRTPGDRSGRLPGLSRPGAAWCPRSVPTTRSVSSRAVPARSVSSRRSRAVPARSVSSRRSRAVPARSVSSRRSRTVPAKVSIPRARVMAARHKRNGRRSSCPVRACA